MQIQDTLIYLENTTIKHLKLEQFIIQFNLYQHHHVYFHKTNFMSRLINIIQSNLVNPTINKPTFPHSDNKLCKTDVQSVNMLDNPENSYTDSDIILSHTKWHIKHKCASIIRHNKARHTIIKY